MIRSAREVDMCLQDRQRRKYLYVNRYFSDKDVKAELKKSCEYGVWDDMSQLVPLVVSDGLLVSTSGWILTFSYNL